MNAHLLTGLLMCSGCDRPLGGTRYQNGAVGRFNRYYCRNRGGVKHSVGAMDAIEAYVVGAWLTIMSQAYLAPTSPADDTDTARDIPAEIATVGADMRRINKMHLIDHTLSDAEWTDLHTELAAKLAELNSIRAAQAAAAETDDDDDTVLTPGSRDDMQAWWNAATLPERRTALRRIFHKIVLLPAAQGRNSFDSARVQIHLSGRYYALGAAAYAAGIMPELTAEEVEALEAEGVIVTGGHGPGPLDQATLTAALKARDAV